MSENHVTGLCAFDQERVDVDRLRHLATLHPLSSVTSPVPQFRLFADSGQLCVEGEIDSFAVSQLWLALDALPPKTGVLVDLATATLRSQEVLAASGEALRRRRECHHPWWSGLHRRADGFWSAGRRPRHLPGRSIQRSVTRGGPPSGGGAPGGVTGCGCPQLRALGLAERGPPPEVGIPANRVDARLGRHLLRSGEDRFASRQTGRSQALDLYPHRHPPVRIADLSAQINLKPDNYVEWITAQALHEEGVPSLLKVGQEHGVIDMTQSVHVTPPDVDRMLKAQAHALTPLKSTQERQAHRHRACRPHPAPERMARE